MSKCCPKDGNTKREFMKEFLKRLIKDIPCARKSIFGAITRSSIKGWQKPELEEKIVETVEN